MAKAVYADLEDVIEANQDMLGDYDMMGIRSGIIKATTKKINVFIEGLNNQENKRHSSSLPVGRKFKLSTEAGRFTGREGI